MEPLRDHPMFDAAASVRIWPVEQQVGSWTLRVPALPASEWLPLVFAQNRGGIWELMEGLDLDGLRADPDVSAEDLQDAVLMLLEAAAGRTWRAACVIAATAADRWDLIGAELARAGIRWDQISLSAALDAMYASARRHLSEEGQAAFIQLLERDPVQQPRAPRVARPLPATSLQYVQTRPKTQPRRPQDRPAAQTEPPRPPLRPRPGSAPPPRSGPRPPGSGVGGDASPPGA